MKNRILLSILMVAATANVIAQKDKSKVVKTKYLSLPAYDLSKTDPSTIAAEFAMAEASFGSQKLKDVKTPCIPKGGGLKDAIEVTTYYYEVPFTKPESYLVVKDPSGNIIYSSVVSTSSEDVIKFGFKKCEYWLSDKLKKDWTSKGSGFKSGEKKKYETEMHKKAMNSTKANVNLSYINQSFKVYGAKGKGFDYVDLESIFEKAQKAYKNIAKSGPNQADFGLLKECIETWEKELATVNLNDKKSRINKSIAKGLHENCARAYMYIYDFDNAIGHGRNFLKLYGNFHTNRTDAFDVLLVNMEMQKIAAENNSSLMADISALNAKAKASSKNSIKTTKLPSSEFARLKMEHMSFRGNQKSNIRKKY